MTTDYSPQETLTLVPLASSKARPSIQISLRFWYIVLAFLVCLPVASTTYLPLVDYPNHLARTDILARYHQVTSFEHNYHLVLQPIPNLAMDLAIPLIAPFTGTILAGKLFLIAVILLYAFGCYCLSVAIFGYDTRAAFVPLLFIYNSTFLMGFINYVAGIALFTIAFAFWLRWRGRWTPRRILAFSALASACYLAHLSSITTLGLSTASVMAWELLRRGMRWTEPLITGAAALPATLAYCTFMRGSGQMGLIEWNTLPGKLIALLCVVRGYDLPFDLLLLFSLLGCCVFLFASRINLSINSSALAPALALLAAFALCPLVLYTSSGADARFVWPAFLLLALSLRIRVPRRRYTLCLSFVVAIFLIRFSFIWWNWHQEDLTARSIVQTLDKLPRGATLYPAFFNTGDINTQKHNRGLEHLACYAVMKRDAFVPSVFALPGQQPLVLAGQRSFHVWSKQTFHPDDYQYMWTFHPPQQLSEWLAGHATAITAQGDSAFWKLRPDAVDLRD